MAALCDLWDPGCGDPGFLHCALLLPSPPCMALFVLVFFLVSALCLMAILEDGTQDVIVRIVAKSWKLSHFSVVFCLCCAFGCFSFFVSCLASVLMGPLTGLCAGPLPVLFCGHLLPDGCA